MVETEVRFVLLTNGKSEVIGTSVFDGEHLCDHEEIFRRSKCGDTTNRTPSSASLSDRMVKRGW